MENKLEKIGQNSFMDNFVKTDDILKDMCGIIESSQKAAYQAVNTLLVQRNWLIGYRIAEEELGGDERSEYGLEVIKKISKELTQRYGKGYDRSNLYHCLKFYKTFPEIVDTACRQSGVLLSWSHYRTLLQVKDPEARDWYEKEAAEQTWSVRTLQIILALYTLAFSSFLDVMLVGNYDKEYLSGISEKLDDYSMKYRELYTQCYEEISGYSSTSIQSSLLKGLSKTTKAVGKIVERIPVVGDTQADETLIAAGEKLSDIGTEKIRKQMRQLIERQSNFVRPFIDNIDTVNRLNNNPVQLLVDKDNLYIATIA